MREIVPILLLVLQASGCVSFKGRVPDEPEIVVDYLSVVRNVDRKTDYGNRVKSEAIKAGDPAVYALIKVVNIAAPLQLQWNWYSPDGKLARQSRAVEVNSRRKFLEYFVAWDALPRTLYEGSKGKWMVVVTADRAFLARTEFDVP